MSPLELTNQQILFENYLLLFHLLFLRLLIVVLLLAFITGRSLLFLYLFRFGFDLLPRRQRHIIFIVGYLALQAATGNRDILLIVVVNGYFGIILRYTIIILILLIVRFVFAVIVTGLDVERRFIFAELRQRIVARAGLRRIQAHIALLLQLNIPRIVVREI